MRWTAVVVTALCGITLAYAARDPEPLPVVPASSAKKVQPVFIEPVAVADARDSRSFDSGDRNLFGFVERAAPVVVPAKTPPPQPVVAQSQPPVAEPAVAREPELGFEYIGTFGPAHDPIAVFKRDGAIVNARGGESVGDFRVERVGFESVSVRAPATNGVRTLPNGR